MWQEKTLGDVAQINYGYTAKASFNLDKPYFLRITDIQNGLVNWGKVPSCEITAEDYEKYKLIDGDIVFARTGATTGKSYLLINPPNAVPASYLIRLRLQSNELLPQFVASFFQTKRYWDSIKKGIAGSAQGGFNASKLSNIKIPTPSLQEQKQIVAKLDKLSKQTQQLETLYQQKLTNLKELKQAILQKAFNGELTD